ncbi:MAG: endopeptidase La, partial [Megasphaera elsdenii]|nr:endopeptidase La [Megasphaera elsdenii]
MNENVVLNEQDILALPFVPLRGIVVYPKLVSHIDIGRDKSLAAVDYAMEHDRQLLVATQVDENEDNPGFDDVYTIGCLVKIEQLLRMPGGLVRILVNGISRVRMQGFSQKADYLEGAAVKVAEISRNEVEEEALRRVVLKRLLDWLGNLRDGEEASENAKNIDEPGVLADFAASQLPLRIVIRQQLLETADVEARLRRIASLLDTEVDIANLESKLNMEVRGKMDQQQKEYYLREKIKAIHEELGDKVDKDTEVQELRDKIKKMKLDEDIEKALLKEVDRLDSMPPMMAESAIIRTYLDWAMALPWKKETKDRLDLNEAQKVLDEDHYGLKKVKDRIIEYLAVKQLTNSLKGPILCFVGPPGTGKTSIAKSIARAMNRKYVRVSLGGVRDEAEIRGHRRTYVGAMPGKIIQGIKRVGVRNPVFVLDEIDKLGSDWRGDPSSAMLEVLDPSQNNAFNDHYLDVAFDLSDVMFIATANDASTIPRPLLDRMEIIELSGYIDEEKFQIARRHIVPKELAEHGMTKDDMSFTPSGLKRLIRSYTREAGVRDLERQVAKVCRKNARRLATGEKTTAKISPDNLSEFLGAPIFTDEVISRGMMPGVAVGLAWTQYGGEILFIESTRMPGAGQLKLTGQLGEVMSESVQIAFSFIRANMSAFKVNEDMFSKTDFHVHFPAGATPKDGPSAGITITTSILSLLLNQSIPERLAMTGEITL